MKKSKVKLISFMLAVIMALLIMSPTAPVAYATDKYITVEDFAEELAKEVGLEKVNGGGVKALISAGIIKDGDFKSYSAYLTRGDALMLLGRADEYLYGDKISPELVKLTIDMRISDIDKIAKAKREDVAKGFLKGFMKGYSDGKCSPSRELRGTKKITRSGALNNIKMLKDKDLRVKISPDGQVIRTTNLPKSVDKFPYILANFPNDFYDWQLEYEHTYQIVQDWEKGTSTRIPLAEVAEVAPPVDVDKITTYAHFAETKEEYIQIWEDKVRTHLEHVFNVDYRTIDDEWVERVHETNYRYKDRFYDESSRRGLAGYVDRMKKNKTIVECEVVGTDKSTLYLNGRELRMRAYVKFRILSSVESFDKSPVITKNIIYGSTEYVFENVKLGEWNEIYIDVGLTSYSSDKPETIGVCDAYVYTFYKEYRIK